MYENEWIYKMMRRKQKKYKKKMSVVDVNCWEIREKGQETKRHAACELLRKKRKSQ